MKEQLMKILNELRPDVDFENETALVTDGILDSFDIVSLVGEINAEFDITVGVDELEPENFDTVAAMLDLIADLAD
ncbi:MAG: acyl carrier protein [Clostridia bacterium]|nr:acyl carrier protein [Clostridia bacterium]